VWPVYLAESPDTLNNVRRGFACPPMPMLRQFLDQAMAGKQNKPDPAMKPQHTSTQTQPLH